MSDPDTFSQRLTAVEFVAANAESQASSALALLRSQAALINSLHTSQIAMNSALVKQGQEFNERYGDLAENVRHTRDRLDTLEKVVAGGFLEVCEKFSNIDSKFEQVDARFESVDARFEQVDARFEQVDARFDKVDARFDRLETRLDGVDVRLDRVDQRFDKVEGVLGEILERLPAKA